MDYCRWTRILTGRSKRLLGSQTVRIRVPLLQAKKLGGDCGKVLNAGAYATINEVSIGVVLAKAVDSGRRANLRMIVKSQPRSKISA